MLKRILVFIFCIQTFSKAHAQVAPVTSGEIFQGLQKLNVLGSVLYIAAHPDDENTRLLTYFAKDKLYRTGYLSLTRGDGGQNLIGDEQGIALGLIRTQELLAARRIDGAEQFFTRAYDFGYSKSPEETFTKWDREKILGDVVWVIRNFRPDVIVTRFPTTGEGGHGHHTASAILANEAFAAAADAKRFPEQLKWVQPWQATRIFWNTFNFGGTNTASTDQFKIDVGGYNAVLGKSYGEIAAESRSQHKSQGFGVPRSRGEAYEFFKKTGGTDVTTDLLEGIDVSWNRVKEGAAISKRLGTLIASFDFKAPQKSIAQLVQLHKALKAAPENYWTLQKAAEVKKLIEQAGGLWLDAFTGEAYVAQTDSLRINFVVNNRTGASVTLESIRVERRDAVFNARLEQNKNFSVSRSYFIPADAAITQPYWLQNKMSEGYYNVDSQHLIGRPDAEPALTATFTVTIEGESFSFTKPVTFKYTDPVKGEIYQPLVIVPPVSVYTQPDLVLFKRDTTSAKAVSLLAVSNKAAVYKKAKVTLLTNHQFTVHDTATVFAKGESKTYNLVLPRKQAPGRTGLAHPMLYFDTATTAHYLARAVIAYDHIPTINYFYSDPVKVLNLDNLKTVGKNIGYIPGAGDKVAEALSVMGYNVVLLTEKELARTNLQQFDAIITGVRAYNVNAWLSTYYDKLMAYVSSGGNLIVQYNTNSNAGPLRTKMGPYPFTISRNRVTDEKAAVTFINSHAQVLNYPNKIYEDSRAMIADFNSMSKSCKKSIQKDSIIIGLGSDFENWVQERSLYHATDLDPAYQTVISMHDKGEQPDAGSLIIAKYGKGYFTYTGLSFFRQLPAGVPGAYRLFANLIALNQKKEL
jgi:LmbE family N-acetylglucosaminyl deacetylase